MSELLRSKINGVIRGAGSAEYESFLAEASPLITWITYFEDTYRSATCQNLLTALRSTIAETGACVLTGFARPAILTMRAEIDVALAWLYYSEHPREWRYVNISTDGYKLKTEILRIFETIEPVFKSRFSLLKQIKRRTQDDPYRLLSAHVHLQSEAVLPSLSSIEDIVQAELLPQLVMLQREVTEYIGDLCFSMFTRDWASLPSELNNTLKSRFISQAQHEDFLRPRHLL